jgi:hypothetical protein
VKSPSRKDARITFLVFFSLHLLRAAVRHAYLLQASKSLSRDSRLLLHFTSSRLHDLSCAGDLSVGDLSTGDLAILLLEIIRFIIGRHAIDVNYCPPSVVDWAVPLIKHIEFVEICDRSHFSDPIVQAQSNLLYLMSFVLVACGVRRCR